MPHTDELIGTSEAARLLRRNPATITRWAADGTLPPAGKLSGKNGALLFLRSVVEAKADDLAEPAA